MVFSIVLRYIPPSIGAIAIDMVEIVLIIVISACFPEGIACRIYLVCAIPFPLLKMLHKRKRIKTKTRLTNYAKTVISQEKRMWRNWQTRRLQVPVSLTLVEVRILSSAFIILIPIEISRLFAGNRL